MTATNAVQLVETISRSIRSTGLLVTRVSHFGSSTHLSQARDIDVLITLQDPPEAATYSYQTELDAIHARMEGDMTISAPRDPFTTMSAEDVITAIRRVTTLPIVDDFGPARDTGGEARIHLNGPVTDRLVTLFGDRFPIHAWVIRNNSGCLVGGPPPAGRITAAAVKVYVGVMQKRLSTAAALDVLKKLLQTIGLICGETSCLPEANLRRAFTMTHPLRLAIESAFKGHSDASIVCDLCLRTLELMSITMDVHKIEYPHGWLASESA